MISTIEARVTGLSRGLVVLKTTWFVVQCTARKARGLVITQLELPVGTRCVKWGCWNKPLGVNRAIPVYLVNHDDPPRSQVPFGGISAFGPAGKREGL